MKNNSNLTSTEKAIGEFCVNVVLYLRKTEKETKILTTNIYSAADAYLSLTYIIILRIMNSSLSVDKKEKILSLIIPTIKAGIISEFDFSEKQFTNIIEKRDVYLDKYMKIVFEKSNGEIVLSDIVDEISEILKYDIIYNQYVEFNETTEILLTEFDESLQIKVAVTHLYKFTIELLDSLLKEVIKKPLKIKKKNKSNFKTATIVLSITTAVFAISTLCLCFGLINQNTNEQEFAAQIETLEADIKQKDSTISRLNTQIANQRGTISSLENDLYFYDSYAVCVNDNSPYYHKPNCVYFDDSSFYIYNTETAEVRGYRECPYCF